MDKFAEIVKKFLRCFLAIGFRKNGNLQDTHKRYLIIVDYT